jgi:hypothetical protein
MFASKRVRIAAATLAVALLSGGIAAAATTAASATTKAPATHKPAPRPARISLNRFDLNGYVINAKYTLGTNTGNTFQQTYTDSTAHGVPIAGPNVGVQFPVEDYVALPIGNDELYITWLDPSTFAIVDVFVFNFKNHTVYDYAPGSSHPESAGYIKVVKRGQHRLP